MYKPANKYAYLTLLIAGLLMISSCKKYEEGPMFSLRSKENRILGEWRVTNYQVNEKDYLNFTNEVSEGYSYGCSSYYTKTSSGKRSFTWDFQEPDNLYILEKTDVESSYEYEGSYGCIDETIQEKTNNLLSGEWEFKNDKKKLAVKHPDEYGDQTYIKYDIIKLTKKEIKLKAFYNNQKHELTLEPK